MSDGDRTVGGSADAPTVRFPAPDVPGQVPVFDGLAAADPPGEEYSAGLPGWGFIAAAGRRSVRFLAAAAVVGMILGLGLYLQHRSYQASTSVVLVPNPAELPTDAILTDIALAQSRTVAQRAEHQLGLQENAISFLGTYKVTAVTDRVLQITASGPSDTAAVARARAVAGSFLAVRAQQLEAQQHQEITALQSEVTQAKQQISTLSTEINRLGTQPATPAQQARLTALRAQSTQAQTQLQALQQAITGNQVNVRLSTTQLVQGSQVLDAATPAQSSHVKHAALYIGMGLIAGLAVGLGLVVVRALVSDRLRRRDDVAHALGVPVRLSVGPVRVSRWLPGRSGLAGARRPGVQRIAVHLRDALPRRGRRPAALAVLAVDDLPVAALSVVAAALSCVREGLQVVLADLCPGAPAARLLGVREPGTGAVSVEGGQLVVVVPGQDDVGPAGPLRPASASARGRPRRWSGPVVRRTCCSRWRPLDPSLGGEHLATWASRRRRGGDRRAVVVDEDPRGGRDDPARRDVAGLRRARRGGQDRREPRRRPRWARPGRAQHPPGPPGSGDPAIRITSR